MNKLHSGVLVKYKLSKLLPRFADHPRESMSSIRLIYAAASVLVISVFVTVVIPGMVAYHGGVFNLGGVVKRLKPEPLKQYQAYEATERDLEAISKSINARLRQADSVPETIRQWLSVKQELDARLASLRPKPPIVVLPFSAQPNLFLFTGPYAALALLLFVVPANPLDAKPRSSGLGVVRLALVIYAIYEAPSYDRNFVSTDAHRVIYAYANRDIYLGSFITQELVIFGFSVLLAGCWYRWAVDGKRMYDRATQFEHDASVFDLQLAELLSETYIRWAWQSLILLLGFFFFTSFYWDVVHGYGDQRYFASAVLAHLLWGVSWVLLSVPLFWTWRVWNRMSRRAISELAQATEDGTERSAEVKLNLLAKFEPIGDLRTSIGWVGAVVSFVTPLALGLLKK
jgi:hypothetical protein